VGQVLYGRIKFVFLKGKNGSLILIEKRVLFTFSCYFSVGLGKASVNVLGYVILLLNNDKDIEFLRSYFVAAACIA
jgi:hypothetical protein